MPVSVNNGNVRGPDPAASTDNAITRWDGTTGRHVQDSNAILNDNGDLQLNSVANEDTAFTLRDAAGTTIVRLSTLLPSDTGGRRPFEFAPNNNNPFPGGGNQVSIMRVRARMGDAGGGGGTQTARFRGVDCLLSVFDDVVHTGLDGNQIRCFNASATWNSTGTCTEIIGIQNFIAASGGSAGSHTTGLVDFMAGNRSKVGYNAGGSAAGSITDGICFWAEQPKDTDANHTLTNSWGVRVDDMNDGNVGVTNSWGLDIKDQTGNGLAIRTGDGGVEFGDIVDTQAGRKVAVTEVTTATYTVLVTDYHISVQYTDTGTQTTTLPAISASNHGQIYHIKDADYNANTNNITIATTGADTVDELATQAIQGDGDCVTVVANNTTKNWEVQ